MKYHHHCGWCYQVHSIPSDEIGGFILLNHSPHLKRHNPLTVMCDIQSIIQAEAECSVSEPSHFAPVFFPTWSRWQEQACHITVLHPEVSHPTSVLLKHLFFYGSMLSTNISYSSIHLEACWLRSLPAIPAIFVTLTLQRMGISWKQPACLPSSKYKSWHKVWPQIINPDGNALWN